jgi:AAA15 family ATPase/GTPase
MLLKSVSINNFRGFKNLEIKDLKPVSLLIGKNNCGKTSVLEALFLLIGGNNPMLPINIYNMRQMPINSDNDFRYLFNDFDIGNTISISAETTNSKKTSLEISALVGPPKINNFNNGENKEIFMQPSATEIRKNDLMGGLCYKFTKTSGESSVHNFSITSIINAKIVASYGVAEIHGIYINSRNMANMATAVGDLIADNAENEIIDVLKEISDIVDIRMTANNIVLVSISIKGKIKRQPINVMGDGIIKIVSILAWLRKVKDGILLIDEIENGLYYSSSSLMLWKAIFNACRTHNVQIVATTHSRECIESFYAAYEAIPDKKPSDGISLIRLDKKNNDTRVVAYNETNIEIAIENEMEVR